MYIALSVEPKEKGTATVGSIVLVDGRLTKANLVEIQLLLGALPKSNMVKS